MGPRGKESLVHEEAPRGGAPGKHPAYGRPSTKLGQSKLTKGSIFWRPRVEPNAWTRGQMPDRNGKGGWIGRGKANFRGPWETG